MERIQLVYRDGRWIDHNGDEWKMDDILFDYKAGYTSAWDEEAGEWVQIIRYKHYVIFRWRDFEIVILGRSLKYL